MTDPNARVLLLTLSERTSAKGRRYMSGWLGRASVVAFEADEPDRYGNAQWEVFVSTPEPRAGEGKAGTLAPIGARAESAGRPDKDANLQLKRAPRDGLAGGARGHGQGAINRDAIRVGFPPDRRQGATTEISVVQPEQDANLRLEHTPGWRGPSAYRRPRAPAPAVPVEQFDDTLEELGR